MRSGDEPEHRGESAESEEHERGEDALGNKIRVAVQVGPKRVEGGRAFGAIARQAPVEMVDQDRPKGQAERRTEPFLNHQTQGTQARGKAAEGHEIGRIQ